MVRLRDAVACLLILSALSAVWSGFAFCLGRATAPVVRVTGPQGEPGKDCNTAIIEAEFGKSKWGGYVANDREQIIQLWAKIKSLEARPACKCEKSVIVRGKPYLCDPCERKR